MLLRFAIILGFMPLASASEVRLEIDGMDCVTCQPKVVNALNALDHLANARASTENGSACAQQVSSPSTAVCQTLDDPHAKATCISGAKLLHQAAIHKALAPLDYTVTAIETVDTCTLGSKRFAPNWAHTDGLDVQIISRGEQVDLLAYQAKDKFTIYDFGAPWCVPCHAAEALLKDYLRDHDDVGLRAIVLDSQDPKVSYKMPVVAQHLLSAPGLPYFLVTNPNGKVIAKGVVLPKLLKKLDRKR